MRSTRYDAEHLAFRTSVRTFMQREVVPYHADWEKDGKVDRAVWIAAGKQGFLGFEAPSEFGGSGIRDFRYNTILGEETMAVGATGLGFGLHNDIVLPYLLQLGTPEQHRRWLPRFCTGELITAIAMSEPGAGSDLQGIRTTARRDGDDFIVNGSKTFITNGIHADLVIVVARTDPEAKASQGTSLLAVERGMPGFERGRKLDKVGMHAQDTAELIFTDVRVPASNLIGELNQGFKHLMSMLPQERLSIAVGAVGSARTVFDLTLQYSKDRKAFGQPIGGFQHNRFALAEMATELELAEVYIDKALEEHRAGRFTAVDAAMVKWWTTELQKRVIDQCLQLHGGYGYMLEYPVAKAFIDARVQTIYGGTTEIMKEIIGRSLGV
jgi:alkylation response protein AidB-like acyl-CoA dehydrogenase